MKILNHYLLLVACVAGAAVFTANATAENTTMPSGCGGMATAVSGTSTNGIPDLLKTCPVSGEKLNGDMGAPFVFSYKGQEVKLCCKGCKKDFDKEPEKYIKLIRAADKNAAKQ